MYLSAIETLLCRKEIGLIGSTSFGFAFLILPNDKLKVVSDDSYDYVTEIEVYVYEKMENIEGKGGYPGYRHFLLFPQCFQKVLKAGNA